MIPKYSVNSLSIRFEPVRGCYLYKKGAGVHTESIPEIGIEKRAE